MSEPAYRGQSLFAAVGRIVPNSLHQLVPAVFYCALCFSSKQFPENETTNFDNQNVKFKLFIFRVCSTT